MFLYFLFHLNIFFQNLPRVKFLTFLHYERSYSCVSLQSNGKFVQKFDQQRTVQNMYAFLRTQIEGKERENRLDQEKWEDLPSSVEHLSEENFQAYLQQTQHVLVAFHVRCK